MLVNLPGRFIGNDEVESVTAQSNATEVDNRKTWAAHSLLRMRAQRENHGLPVRCVAMHPTSLTPISTESRLDVHCTYNRSLLELTKQTRVIGIKSLSILKNQIVIKETYRKIVKRNISLLKSKLKEKLKFTLSF